MFPVPYFYFYIFVFWLKARVKKCIYIYAPILKGFYGQKSWALQADDDI